MPKKKDATKNHSIAALNPADLSPSDAALGIAPGDSVTVTGPMLAEPLTQTVSSATPETIRFDEQKAWPDKSQGVAAIAISEEELRVYISGAWDPTVMPGPDAYPSNWQAWLALQLEQPQSPEARQRLTLLRDTLTRYQLTAAQFAEWWSGRESGE